MAQWGSNDALDLDRVGLYAFQTLFKFILISICPMLSAYILIEAEAGKEREILEALNSNENVVDVSIVYGQYDIVAKIVLNEGDELPSFMMDVIRPINGISGTSTLLSAYDPSRP
jgi:DNA-binding Lrp family transcriptional regulator